METPPVNPMGEKDTSQPQQQWEKNPQENLDSTAQIRQQPQDPPTDILELRVSPNPVSQILEKPQGTEKLASGLQGDSAKSHGSTSEMPEPLQTSDLWLTLASFTQGRDSWELEAGEKEALAREERARGTELFRAGNPEGAARCYGRALRLLLTLPPPGPPERTVLHANLAACQLLLGQPQLAAQSCDRVLEREPDHLKALYRRGVAQAALGNLEKATADLRKVLAVDPKNRAAQEELGKVIIQGKKQDAGLAQGLRKMFG
ncbi:FK506-binding protein-like isoform X2 [Eumetopias jubatus]|uniref:FK506-binding protein-like isoform X2 n=1 Tax=Eumetopias jubatus TaxID=34886 RepID=UPI00101713B3|nr:FK506-binding protein-like isoform X2 [Eumetopias jubatus]